MHSGALVVVEERAFCRCVGNSIRLWEKGHWSDCSVLRGSDKGKLYVAIIIDFIRFSPYDCY